MGKFAETGMVAGTAVVQLTGEFGIQSMTCIPYAGGIVLVLAALDETTVYYEGTALHEDDACLATNEEGNEAASNKGGLSATCNVNGYESECTQSQTGMMSHPKVGVKAKVDQSSVKRDLYLAFATVEPDGKACPDEPTDGDIADADGINDVGQLTHAAKELILEVYFVTMTHIIEKGLYEQTTSGLHLTFAGVYTTTYEGDTAKVGLASVKIFCQVVKICDTIGGSFCAVESPEVCQFGDVVDTLKTEGTASRGQNACGCCRATAIDEAIGEIEEYSTQTGKYATAIVGDCACKGQQSIDGLTTLQETSDTRGLQESQCHSAEEAQQAHLVQGAETNDKYTETTACQTSCKACTINLGDIDPSRNDQAICQQPTVINEETVCTGKCFVEVQFVSSGTIKVLPEIDSPTLVVLPQDIICASVDVVISGCADESCGPKENATSGYSTFGGIGPLTYCNTKSAFQREFTVEESSYLVLVEEFSIPEGEEDDDDDEGPGTFQEEQSADIVVTSQDGVTADEILSQVKFHCVFVQLWCDSSLWSRNE